MHVNLMRNFSSCVFRKCARFKYYRELCLRDPQIEIIVSRWRGSARLVKLYRDFAVLDRFSSSVIGCATREIRMYDIRMQAYFRMPYIATLLNACNANDDVHYKTNLLSLMQCVCLL